MEKIWGKNSVFELLKAGRRKVDIIDIMDTPQNRDWANRIKSFSGSTKIHILSSDKFKKKYRDLPSEISHQGVITEATEYQYLDHQKFKKIISEAEKSFILILDSIQDPHNLGSILRSSHCFGVDLVIIPKDRSADINATVLKSSAGASEHIQIFKTTNLNQVIKDLKKEGYWVYTTSLDSKNDLSKFSPPSKMALILGNEAKGPRELIQKNADDSLSISMKNDFDSLNVANAASIFIYMISQKREILD